MTFPLVLVSLALALCLALSGGDATPGRDAAEIPLGELVARIPRVDAPSSDPQTVEACAELARRLKAGVALSSDQWKHLLLDTGVLSVRPRWPVGEPLAVSALGPEWLVHERIVLHPILGGPGLSDIRVERFIGDCGNAAMAWTDASVHQTLGTLPIGRHRILFRIEVWSPEGLDERLRPRPGRPWFADHCASAERRTAADALVAERGPRPLSTGELELAVEIVPTLDDAVPPVSTPELDRALAKALSVSFVGKGDERRARLVLDDDPPFERVGLSLEVELLEGAESRLAFRLLPRDRGFWSGGGFGPDAGLSLPVPLALEHDVDSRRTWSLRVRGTSEWILRDWAADCRWSGALELPLDELLARGEKPRKR